MEKGMPTEIDRKTLTTLVRDGARLIEVLSSEQYERAHLAGAISIPLGSLDRQSVVQLAREQPVIVYCYDCQ